MAEIALILTHPQIAEPGSPLVCAASVPGRRKKARTRARSSNMINCLTISSSAPSPSSTIHPSSSLTELTVIMPARDGSAISLHKTLRWVPGTMRLSGTNRTWSRLSAWRGGNAIGRFNFEATFTKNESGLRAQSPSSPRPSHAQQRGNVQRSAM